MPIQSDLQAYFSSRFLKYQASKAINKEATERDTQMLDKAAVRPIQT